MANQLSSKKDSVTVIVPMYNESEMASVFFRTIVPVLQELPCDYEILCVNDGSTDDTWQHICDHAQGNPSIKGLNLSRNFGKEIALSAGLEHAEGGAVIPIDCDLQDPPTLIAAMVEEWQKGFDVVLAKRTDRESDSAFKRWTSSAFYSLISRIAEIEIPANVGDFRLLDRKVVNYLLMYPERTRFMKGIFASVGFNEAVIEYSRPERAAGETKWNYWQLYRLALEGIISFTSFPLKIWSYLGATIALAAFLFGGFLVFRTLVFGVDTPGYASLMVVILFMSGLILLSLGIIGEYLARIFVEVKRRPLYIVMDKCGFSGD